MLIFALVCVILALSIKNSKKKQDICVRNHPNATFLFNFYVFFHSFSYYFLKLPYAVNHFFSNFFLPILQSFLLTLSLLPIFLEYIFGEAIYCLRCLLFVFRLFIENRFHFFP